MDGSNPFNGLGDLPFYTYVTYRINDRVELKVNVANGNLLAHTTDLHIRGTGLDESIEGYYNSQDSLLFSDHGNNWVFGTGRDIHLDLSAPTIRVNLYGPSGYIAYFGYNSQTHSYTDCPGLNATLVANQDGTYTMTFHRTGGQLIFGANSHLIAQKDKNGNTITYSYDIDRDLLSLTDTQNRETSFTHNTAYGLGQHPEGQLTSLTDPMTPTPRTVQYSYGERGNPANSFTSLTDALGKVTKFDYNGQDLTSITDPLGNVTTITYNSGDIVHTITDATSNGHITFAYNSGNTVVTDRNGNNTTYTYDTQKLQVTQVTDALGHSKTTQFNANYDVTQYGDALNDFSNFTFSNDGRNNLTTVTDGNGAATQFGYPSSGNNLFYPLNQTDPQGNVTNYAYDSNGNMLSATNNSTGKGLTYTYNSNGTIATQKDANNHTTNFGYDGQGNLTSVTSPNPLGAYTLVPDSVSRVTSVTDGNDNQTTYGYDKLDRIKTITYAGGASISYKYDENSNLLSEVDNTGTTSFTYDVLNRIKTKTLPGGAVIRTDYDKNGNLTSFIDGEGTVTYVYDAANRMTTLKDPDTAHQTLYGYDKADRKTSIQYPNSTGMLMTYDKAGHQLSSIGGKMNAQGQITTTYSSFTYSYKAGSTQTALLQTVDLLDPINWQSGTIYHRAYTYDSQNRLTIADVTQSGSEVEKYTYSYDNAGNRLSSSVLSTGISTTYQYNAGNELTSKTQSGGGGGTTSYSYDGNGNLTGSSPGSSLTYNTKNQTKTNGSDTYTYSGPDQRDRVQVNSTTFIYSGLGLSSRSDSSGTTYFTRCSCGLLNSERTPDGKKYYYLFDGLGSIVGLTDSTGAKVNSYDYDPYGVMVNQQEKSGVNNPWKFAGGYLDSSTSLYKFGVRYYDPTLGRWTQQDVAGGGLGDLNAANRYTYANDDPVNLVDPSGKDCLTTFLSDLASVGFFLQLAWLGLNFIGAILDANPLVGIILLFLYVAWGFPILIGIVIAFYNNAAQACGWPLIG